MEQYLYLGAQCIAIALPLTIIIYLIIYRLISKKRGRVSKLKAGAEFLLIGWFITMLLVVFKAFLATREEGAGMNFEPLLPIFQAIRYGLNSSHMFNQFYLNILMFVPLGVLAPIVFNKLDSYPRITGVSFIITLLIEVIQGVVGRCSDIDDVIANTLGGMAGYGILVIVRGIYRLVTKKDTSAKKGVSSGIATAILTLALLAPIIAVNVNDAFREFGSIKYENYMPGSIELSDKIAASTSDLTVYKPIEADCKKIMHSISAATGWKFDYESIKDNGFLYWNEETDDLVSVDSDGSWFVDYGIYNGEYNTNLARDKCVEFALKYCSEFGIDTANLEYLDEVDRNYGDGTVLVCFKDNTDYGDRFMWSGCGISCDGDIEVRLGENGVLLEIYDNRVYYEPYKSVKSISPLDGVKEIKYAGRDRIDAAVIENYTLSYELTDKGYLIPVWQYTGKATSKRFGFEQENMIWIFSAIDE